MPQYQNLYVDISSGTFVSGQADSSSAQPLIWNQGDTKFFNIYLLQPNSGSGTGLNPYTTINVTGLMLMLDIGDRDGSGSASLTWQYTWTVINDLTGSYFQGSVSLNQASINAKLDGVANYGAWLQMRIKDIAGNQSTVLQLQISLVAEVGSPAVVAAPPAGLVAISRQEALAEFVPIMGPPGQGFYLTSPDGTKKVYFNVGNDGAVHEDQVS